MRVVVTCDGFLKYSVAKAKAMRAAGVEVLLCCRAHAIEFEFGEVDSDRAELLDNARAAGVKVVELPGRVRDLRYLPRVVYRLLRIIAWRPDVIDMQDHSDPRLLWLGYLHRTVVTVHDPVPHPGEVRPKRGRLTRKLALRSADAFVVHGESLRDELTVSAALGHRPVYVLPHGTEITSVTAPPASPRVLMFGRLEVYKGLPVLLDAMNEVWHSRPDVQLVIAGRGREASLIPDDDFRIETQIGYIPERALNALIDDATVVVLPYLQASGSGVGTQAIGRGVPVIVTATGTLPTLARDPSYVVPTGDCELLAEAIVSHLEAGIDERRRVLKYADEHHSWRLVAERAIAQFREVASR
jgi:glycosyltransferase involved in cell wall biosynthesis